MHEGAQSLEFSDWDIHLRGDCADNEVLQTQMFFHPKPQISG